MSVSEREFTRAVAFIVGSLSLVTLAIVFTGMAIYTKL